MNRAHLKMREFAQSIITHEAKGRKSSEIFAVGEKLRPHLATLLGSVGFRALLARSLALAGEKVRWLRTLQVKSDGSLDGLEEITAKMDPEEIAEGRLVLLAELLGLIVTFIGEILTLQLVLEVWPKLPLKKFKFFGKGNHNEKKE